MATTSDADSGDEIYRVIRSVAKKTLAEVETSIREGRTDDALAGLARAVQRLNKLGRQSPN